MPITSTNNSKLLVLGKFFPLEVKRKGKKYELALEKEKIRIRIPESVKRRNLEYDYLRKWLRIHLAGILDEFIATHTKNMGVYVNKIHIKNQKTRWASCSSNHNVNFNIQLVALPRFLIEYIVIHELAHMTHKNHSRKFWQLVQKFCPHYKRRRQELRRYSLALRENKMWGRITPI